MEELATRRALNQGFSNAMNRAIELVALPLLFGALGLFLDHVLVWTPVLTIALAGYGLAGGVLRIYYAYNAQMKAAEAGKPWTRLGGAK